MMSLRQYLQTTSAVFLDIWKDDRVKTVVWQETTRLTQPLACSPFHVFFITTNCLSCRNAAII